MQFIPAITCRPRPRPSFAPSMIPAGEGVSGYLCAILYDLRRSRICIGAPWTLTVPGTVVRVVKSIAETSECVPVSFDINVD